MIENNDVQNSKKFKEQIFSTEAIFKITSHLTTVWTKIINKS